MPVMPLKTRDLKGNDWSAFPILRLPALKRYKYKIAEEDAYQLGYQEGSKKRK